MIVTKEEKNKMFLTIARLAASIAIGIVLNLFVNYLKKKKIQQEKIRKGK